MGVGVKSLNKSIVTTLLIFILYKLKLTAAKNQTELPLLKSGESSELYFAKVTRASTRSYNRKRAHLR